MLLTEKMRSIFILFKQRFAGFAAESLFHAVLEIPNGK